MQDIHGIYSTLSSDRMQIFLKELESSFKALHLATEWFKQMQ